MEIRLKIWEILVVAIGLLASGVMIGNILTGHLAGTSAYLYLGMVLFVPLTIIMRRRYSPGP